jgi:hypothetical protein
MECIMGIRLLNDPQEFMDAGVANKLTFSFIHDRLRRRYCPFTPTIYSMLGINLEDGIQNFADIILEALDEFEEFNSLVIQANVDKFEDSIIFKDNFHQWIDGEIDAVEVQFKPSAVIHIGNQNTFNRSIKSANQWSYDPIMGKLSSLWSSFYIKYYCNYPYKIELTPDKRGFTENSAIYFLTDVDIFTDLCALHIFTAVKSYQGMVQLPGYSSQYNLDELVQKLTERVEENRSRSSSIYEKWRNM